MNEYISRVYGSRNPKEYEIIFKTDSYENYRELQDYIRKMYQPAADVQEVRHGRWIDTNHCDYSVQCSECGSSLSSELLGYDYCPKCGAKMDGGDTH